MVTLREATPIVADLLGRPVATVNTRALRLRGARLVPVEGRGLNAAHLGTRHLVRLLLAAMLPDTKLVDVAARVKKLDVLRHSPELLWEDDGILSRRASADVVAEFDKVRNLSDALVILLGHFQRGATPVELGTELVDFSIHISATDTQATIRLVDVEHPDEVISVAFGLPGHAAPLVTSVAVRPQVFVGLAELMQDAAA